MNVQHHRTWDRRRALGAAFLSALAAAGTTLAGPAPVGIELVTPATYASGIFDDAGAEIVAYDRRTRRVFAVNASDAVVDVLDVSDPSTPTKVDSIDVATALAGDSNFTGTVAGANSVAVGADLLAVAVEADPKTDNGWAAFFDTTTLALVGWVEAGALPDMITFGTTNLVFVANEGEPNSYGQPDSVDPEGSVTIVRIKGKQGARRFLPSQVDFRDFNGDMAALKAAGVRIFGPGASVAQDLEPEYIAVADRNRTLYVTLQENNALAEVDIRSRSVVRILPLGYKDHSLADNGFGSGNAFDGSDRDGPGSGGGSAGLINIANWPVKGMYMPDGIASYSVGGQWFLVTANEGDSRADWLPGDEARLSSLTLDPTVFPNAAALKHEDAIGRLTVAPIGGDTDTDGDIDVIYAFGGRSFSIRDTDGNLVWDSGDQFERILAQEFPLNFNSDHAANNFDNRSDNKGPEPEGVTLGVYRGRTYAFIGLERMSGIMIYDVTDPYTPTFVRYHSTRDFAGSPAGGTAGDLGPEGLVFVRAGGTSPDGKAKLIVGNEVSGTTTLHTVQVHRPE